MSERPRFVIAVPLLLLAAAGCADAPGPGSGDAGVAPSGHVGYMLADDHHAYVATVSPAGKRDITRALDAVSPGKSSPAESGVALARDYSSIAVITSRLDCDYDCLALVPSGDFSGAHTVSANGAFVHPTDRPAIAAGANLIVYSAQSDGSTSHQRDLFLIRQLDGTRYDAPVLLTRDSTFAFNLQPTFSHDESALLFDCSPTGLANSITLCRVNLDGSQFRIVVSPTDGPGGTPMNEVHSVSEEADGSLVFKADWMAERIWRRSPNGTLAPIGNYNDDSTPCVLPDGKIASMWANAPTPGGVHQLKVMSPDGASYVMLENGDIIDEGLSCAQ